MKILLSDHGLCLELAITLARAGHKVGYYITPVDKHSLHSVHQMGSGFEDEGVERVYNFHSALDLCNVVIFPDTHNGDEVDWLRTKHYNVFGAGATAERLELDRWWAKQKMLTLPHNKSTKVIGVKALMAELEVRHKNDECFIKCSGFREIETFKHETWETTLEQFIAPLFTEYGNDPTLEFIIETPIDPAVEVGSDSLCNHGNWPVVHPYGYESKDSAYIGKFNSSQLPKVLEDVNVCITPHLTSASTFVSTEVRVAPSGNGYPVDLTIRAPHPPMAAMLEALKHLDTFITNAAWGLNNVVELSPRCAYAAVLVGTSGWANDHRMELVFEDKLRPYVKLFKAYKVGYSYYVLPSSSFACVVGIGNTVDQAVKGCKMTAEGVKGRELSFDFSSLDTIVSETIPQGKKCGINF